MSEVVLLPAPTHTVWSTHEGVLESAAIPEVVLVAYPVVGPMQGVGSILISGACLAKMSGGRRLSRLLRCPYLLP